MTRYFLFKLFAGLILCCFLTANAYADTTRFLIQNTWHMKRSTHMGEISTVFFFHQDGRGVSIQRVFKDNKSSVQQHGFSYTVNNKHLVVQEDIEEPWRGVLGLTKWTITQDKLIGHIRFRGKQITMRRIKK